MAVRPAAIGQVAGHGGELAVGAPANLTLVDPAWEWTVDPATLASRSRNTPFAGHTFPATVVATLLRGRFTARDGSIRSEVLA